MTQAFTVFCTRKIPQVGIDMLQAFGAAVHMHHELSVMSTDALIKNVHTYNPHALITMVDDVIDDRVFAVAPQLKIVANYAVGFNNVNLEHAVARNIVVTNTPDVLTDAVAEHTFALILSITRHVVASDTFARDGKFSCWDPMGFLGLQLKGATLGLVGVGRIGSRVAEIATRGFGMHVCYYDIARNEQFEKVTGAFYCAKVDSVLRNADVVSLHVPLTDATRHLIDAPQLALMKRSAYVINTARGAVVNEEALRDALKNNTIAGAGLDVFEHEPAFTEGLLDLPNVVITPHIGSATLKAREAMSKMVANNIIAVLSGKMAANAITKK